MKRKRVSEPRDKAVLVERFTGADGLLAAINHAASKLIREGSSIDLAGVSGVLKLTCNDVGSYELKITEK